MDHKDNHAKKLGFVVAIPEELYFQSINKQAALFVELIDKDWHCWREVKTSSGYNNKDISISENFYHVMKKANDYFNYLKRLKRK
ncbi:hypothetical protein HPK19_11875 [Arthrobacter citreus]|nr:hypothetical protein HPK19_11875 [Arthrobacter citreus]